jgi:DNA-binding beta-propeller fold protein YncE
VGTYQVGLNPVGLVFDGANIWSANQGEDTVTKLRAFDGKLLGTFAVGLSPVGLAFDGINVWTANRDGDSLSRR